MDRQTELGKDGSPEDTEKQKCKVVILSLFTVLSLFCAALYHIYSIEKV